MVFHINLYRCGQECHQINLQLEWLLNLEQPLSQVRECRALHNLSQVLYQQEYLSQELALFLGNQASIHSH